MNVVVVEGMWDKIGVRRGSLVISSRSGRKVLPLSDIDRIAVVSSCKASS